MRPLLLLATMLLGVQVSADVLFESSTTPEDRAEIRRVYRRLPRRSHRVPVSLGIEPNSGYCGLYDSEARRIAISRYCVRDWAFAHEMGHHTMEATFSSDERDRWTAFWQANLEQMPTPYARTSPEEGYAESFRYYFMNRKRVHPNIRRELAILHRGRGRSE